MAKSRRSGSGYFDLVMLVQFVMIDSDVPVLVGVATGLPGALMGAIAGVAVGFGTLDSLAFLPMGQVGRLALGAGLLGYPIAAWGGVVFCYKRRGAAGFTWLALLGALSCAALGMAAWLAVGRDLVLGTAEQHQDLYWVGLVGVVAVVVLIPAVASLAYDLKRPFSLRQGGKSLGSRAAPTPAPRSSHEKERRPAENVGPVSMAPEEVVGQAAAGEFGCAECGHVNPSGRDSCGECGASLAGTTA